MKIIEVIPNLNSGGAERFVVDLSNQLSLLPDTDVFLITLYKLTDKDVFVNDLCNNVTLYALNKKKGFDFLLLIRLFKYIIRIKPDIVHSHIGALEYLSLNILLSFKTKFFHTIHNDALKESNGISLFLRKLLFKLNLCHPVTISDESNKSFISVYKKTPTLIYNGCSSYIKKQIINIDEYRYTNKTKVFINVARIVKQKNQDMLVRVFNKLILSGEDIVLLILGRIGDNSIYNNKIKPFLSDRIIYIGEKDNPRDYMVNADYFCLSSTYEGMPITLMEAFSVGCIPICTPVGGNVDLVKNNYNGFLSHDITEKSYEDSITSAIQQSNDDYFMMKNNVLKTYNNCTMEKCAKSYYKIFTKYK